MEKTRKRMISLLVSQIDILCDKIDESLDLFIEERPFLTGGDKSIVEQPKRRRELKIELDTSILGVMSTWNQLK